MDLNCQSNKGDNTNEALAKSMDLQTFVDKKPLKGALLFCGVYNMEK